LFSVIIASLLPAVKKFISVVKTSCHGILFQQTV